MNRTSTLEMDRNLQFIRGRKDEKRWPEQSMMSRVLSKGLDEIYPKRVFPVSEPLKGCISHFCAQKAKHG